jgi:hypothetical protein
MTRQLTVFFFQLLFYGYPVERLCTFQYSLISLIPGLLRSLQDSGAPELDTSDKNITTTEAKVLSDGSKDSLLKYMGLPLHIFEKVYLVQLKGKLDADLVYYRVPFFNRICLCSRSTCYHQNKQSLM